MWIRTSSGHLVALDQACIIRPRRGQRFDADQLVDVWNVEAVMPNGATSILTDTDTEADARTICDQIGRAFDALLIDELIAAGRAGLALSESVPV